jgi:replicative superfamily II helicase
VPRCGILETSTAFVRHIECITHDVALQTGYYTNENLLVCAPTGAGKTNIAMIAVLREIGLHLHGGVLAKDGFKIVYVAPMKALAAEVTRTFGNRLAPLGIQVCIRHRSMCILQSSSVQCQPGCFVNHLISS